MKTQVVCLTIALLISGFNTYPANPKPFRQRQSTVFPGWILRVNLSQTENGLTETEPWTPTQLIAPADLAAIINDPLKKKPIIICVGPGALIKGSVDMGPASEKENLEKLKQYLNKLATDTDVVIYCGCCPFEHCPNIRPAFTLLNEMRFSRAHLLNLEHNIKTDWVAKGYPQASHY